MSGRDREIAWARVDQIQVAIDMLTVALATTGNPVERKRIQEAIAQQELMLKHMRLHLPNSYQHARRRSDRLARRYRR